MTIDEGIKGLTELSLLLDALQEEKRSEAARFGAAGLKELKSIRACYPNTPWKMLPGETEA